MSVNINLVDRIDPKDLKAEKIKKIKGISFAVLIFTALFALTIFALDFRFSASYVRKQQAELLNELSSYNDKSAKIFIVNSNLTEISKILGQRRKFNTTTSQIYEGLNGVEIEEFKIDDNGIILIANSNSLESIDKFLNSMLELVNKKVLASVILKELAFGPEGYKIEVVML